MKVNFFSFLYVCVFLNIYSLDLSRFDPQNQLNARLYLAALQGNISAARQALDLGADDTAQDMPFMLSAMDERARKFSQDVGGCKCPLCAAVYSGHTQMAQFLNSWFPVHADSFKLAAMSGNIDIAESFASRGASMALLDDRSVILSVAEKGCVPMMDWLVYRAGIDLNKNNYKHAALVLAHVYNHASMIRSLTARGANLEAILSVEDGEALRGKDFALIEACAKGDLQVAQSMLAQGANPTALQGDALIRSVFHGRTGIVQLLLSQQITYNQEVKDNALQATYGADLEIVQALVNCGANINACRVLQEAAIRQKWNVVEFLLQNGGNRQVLTAEQLQELSNFRMQQALLSMP